jgi:DinB superfamily
MSGHAHHLKESAHKRLSARLREQAGDIRQLTSGLGEEEFARRVIPEKWSLKELVCHLWRVQQVFDARIASLLAEDNPAIASYDPDHDTEFARLVAVPAAGSLQKFFQEREELLSQWESLSPAQWHRPGRHPDFPHYDVHFQAEYMGHHEAHHIYQMYQRRVMLGKIPHA